MSPYLTTAEVAARYRTSPRAIHGKTRVDAIPYLHRVGFKGFLYSREHLDLWDAGAVLETVTLPDGSKLVRPASLQDSNTL